MFKFLLKFIPIESIIDYICNLAHKYWAKKTKTELDDNLIEVMRDALKMWASMVSNPSKSLAKACLRESLLDLLDFADEDIRKEVETKLKDTEK